MASCLSMGTIFCNRVTNFNGNGPSASISLRTGSKTRVSISLTKAHSNSGICLASAFTPPSSSLSFSLGSSFSGSTLGFGLTSSVSKVAGKRRGLVVRATKYSLCQTKRNRSRKSLARTHGFRKRMSTTGGRVVIKRRRAKGRRILCTKTNPNSGKR